MTRHVSAFAILSLALGAQACNSRPRALVRGQDACRYCRMAIDDTRFGAMLLSTRGKVDTFDSIECLASFVASLPANDHARQILVADFDAPDRWLDVAQARFLHNGSVRSPMGRAYAAFPPEASDASLVQRYGGRTMAWHDVLAMVQRDQFAPTGAPSAHTH